MATPHRMKPTGEMFARIKTLAPGVQAYFESKEVVELPIEFVRDYRWLAYAFTNVGCQGRSLDNLAEDGVLERGLTIWDTGSPYFTRAHLFTGTSRCRSGSILQVV